MPFYPELSFQNPNLYNRPINNVPNGYNRPTNSLQQNASGNNNRFLTLIETFNLVFKHTSLFNQIFRRREQGSKPQRPQPMEIDQSMRTANVNYQNRPRSRQQNLDSEMEYQEEPTANFDENEYFQLLQNEDIEKYAESYDQWISNMKLRPKT
ncbi:unnamed protein product [Ceratitis capitata]|uniref:(Mediterranean fruit fly) hypothetical protein n=1 Tax=Ceratitis capitata TaxID=7213 RepID=A0A811URB8_CERCA|nr:unnamed protein product [Ceratitis capitata]